MPRRRLGVVLLVPPPTAHEVDGLRRALGDPALGRIAPHVTLIPPVNVREDDLDQALSVVRAVAASTGPVTLELGPVESFLPVNPVVYLAVGGPGLPTVHAMQQRLHDGPLARPLSHEFVPHVTVADDLDPEKIPKAMSVLADYRHAVVVVPRLHLLEERRDADDQRIWLPIAGIALGRPSVVGRGGLELVIEVHDRVPPDGDHLEVEVEAPALVLVGRRDGRLVGVATGHGPRPDHVVVAADVEGEGIEDHLRAAYEWRSS